MEFFREILSLNKWTQKLSCRGKLPLKMNWFRYSRRCVEWCIYSMINKRRLCETHLPPWRTTDVTQWRWTIGSTVNSGCAGSIQIETPMTTYHAMTIGCNIIGRCGPIVRWQEVAQNARLSVDCKPSILPTYLTCENIRKNYQKKCCD